MLANKRNGTLYTGVTSNLAQRVEQHRNGTDESFSGRYKLHYLVYYEVCPSMEAAILREKQLKGRSRKKKLVLIEKTNPTWRDLTADI